MGNRKVIVTGATSFIGKALIERILEMKQYEVVAVVAPNSLRKKNIPESGKIHIIEADLKDMDMINVKALDDVDIIFHVAWSSRFNNPRYNLEGQMQNVDYMGKIINLGRKIGCRKVLGIGSQAECGRVLEPIAESTPDKPETAYAIAKCHAYEKGMKLCEQYGIDFYWPRILSAYGPGDNMHTMIMSCLDAAVYNKKIALTKCDQIWDYIYVSDVANALIGIADKGIPGIKYTLASGCGKKLVDYISEIAEITSASFLMDGIGQKEYVDGQVMYLVGDIRRLSADIGFQPVISFSDGIQKILAENFNFFVKKEEG